MTDLSTLPTAELRPNRRLSLAWIAPALALVFAGWLVYRTWTLRGVSIYVQLDSGHGLRSGDDLRFLGTTVGEVRDVHLLDDLDGVEVVAQLKPQARELARGGSRFWVVRPELALDRVTGLETIVGPRYLAVRPGDGDPRVRFVGLPAPPPVQDVRPGDLEIVLEATRRQGLRVGAPVMFRQVRIGTVLSVALSSDAGSVESRLHIEARFAQLVRPETILWPVGGVRADLGLGGLSLKLESLQTLLVGGVALATPPDSASPVHTGHRFRLADEAPDEWLEWQPMAVIGSELLPPGTALPTPLRVTVGWRQGWLFKGQRSRQGWSLLTAGGLLGPADLLRADVEDAVLEVAGMVLSAADPSVWESNDLVLLEASIDVAAWSADAVRVPDAPEDCLVVADPSAAPLSLSLARLEQDGDRWRVDAAVPLDSSWHGACAVSRRDGALIGILLIDDENAAAAIAPVPKELLAP